MPIPPGPVSVTRRASAASSASSASSALPADEARQPVGQVADPPRRVRSGGKSVGKPCDVELEQALGPRHVLEHVRPRSRSVVPVGQRVGDEGRRRLGQDDLAAMADGRDPGRAVDVEAAVVVAGQMGLAASGGPSGPGPRAVRPRLRGQRRCASAAAATAATGLGKAAKNASPSVRTMTPPCRLTARPDHRQVPFVEGVPVGVRAPARGPSSPRRRFAGT